MMSDFNVFHLLSRVTISLAENCAARVHRLLTCTNKIWLFLSLWFVFKQHLEVLARLSAKEIWSPVLSFFYHVLICEICPVIVIIMMINNHIDDDGAQVVGQWVILNWLLTFYYIAWTPESPVQGVEQGGWLVKCLMNVHVCTFVQLYVNVSLCARGYICVHLCVFPCDCLCVDCDIAD